MDALDLLNAPAPIFSKLVAVTQNEPRFSKEFRAWLLKLDVQRLTDKKGA